MINLSFSFPSVTPGAILDVKKGRSTISFTRADLQFLADVHDTIEANTYEDEDHHDSGLLVDSEEEKDLDYFDPFAIA